MGDLAAGLGAVSAHWWLLFLLIIDNRNARVRWCASGRTKRTLNIDRSNSVDSTMVSIHAFQALDRSHFFLPSTENLQNLSNRPIFRVRSLWGLSSPHGPRHCFGNSRICSRRCIPRHVIGCEEQMRTKWPKTTSTSTATPRFLCPSQ